MNKKDFKFLETVTYLDNAAGTIKPNCAIKAVVDFYENYPINPHSVDSKIGIKLSSKIKEIRENTAIFNKVKSNEVIFTSGTTDGLNRVANMMETIVKQGDEILLHYLNHSTNVIVWIELAKKTGAKVVFSSNIEEDINNKTKIIALAQMNNTLDNPIDMVKLSNITSKNDIFLINDAAQAVTHEIVDGNLADFTVWSTNKVYGPTGLGVLIIKESLQKLFEPVRFGGGANVSYTASEWVKKDSVAAREAGTPNTAGIIMHGAVLEYLNKTGFDNIWKHEKEIAEFAFDKLSEISNIILISKRGDVNLIFNIKGVSSQDVVSSLGHKNILLRAGQHCVRTLKEITGESTWIRASIAMYTSKEDINKLVEALKVGGDFLEFI